MTTTRLTIGLAAAVLAVGVAAGCGGGSSSSSSSAPPSTQEPATSTPATGGSSTGGSSTGGSSTGGTVVEIDIAQSGFAFVKSKATAPAGKVTLKAMNPQSTPHNISIESDDGSVDQDGPNVSDGGVSQVTVTLQPGKYTYYCSVPGHEDAGMKGTLTVT
jgi:plastocyanin